MEQTTEPTGVMVVVKDSRKRANLLERLRSFSIPYTEAPTFREAEKRRREDLRYQLICYDPNGLGAENGHDLQTIVDCTAPLRAQCNSARLVLLNDGLPSGDLDRFDPLGERYPDIAAVCQDSIAADYINGFLHGGI